MCREVWGFESLRGHQVFKPKSLFINDLGFFTPVSRDATRKALRFLNRNLFNRIAWICKKDAHISLTYSN
jgi:hypothetical protein